jgi:hypothetical protein
METNYLFISWNASGLESWSSGNLEEFGKLMSESGLSSIQNYECGMLYLYLVSQAKSFWLVYLLVFQHRMWNEEVNEGCLKRQNGLKNNIIRDLMG